MGPDLQNIDTTPHTTPDVPHQLDFDFSNFFPDFFYYFLALTSLKTMMGLDHQTLQYHSQFFLSTRMS